MSNLEALDAAGGALANDDIRSRMSLFSLGLLKILLQLRKPRMISRQVFRLRIPLLCTALAPPRLNLGQVGVPLSLGRGSPARPLRLIQKVLLSQLRPRAQSPALMLRATRQPPPQLRVPLCRTGPDTTSGPMLLELHCKKCQKTAIPGAICMHFLRPESQPTSVKLLDVVVEARNPSTQRP